MCTLNYRVELSLSGFVDLNTLFVHFFTSCTMPFPLQNEHLDMLDDAMVENCEFLSEYAGQIRVATDSIFKEIRSKIGVEYNDEVRFDKLNQRSVPRERLSEWLETVCRILDNHCVPLLQSAVETATRQPHVQEKNSRFD